MITAYQELNRLSLTTELKAHLHRLLSFDEQRLSLPTNKAWSGLIPRLAQMMMQKPEQIHALTDAWNIMYLASVRMDHTQDVESDLDVIAQQLPVSIQYQLFFTYYVFATQLLTQLHHVFPDNDLLKLYQLWSESMLQLSGGQLGSLLRHDELNFANYQSIILRKAGVVFSLAFASVAILANLDAEQVENMSMLGAYYGCIVQIQDDRFDGIDLNLEGISGRNSADDVLCLLAKEYYLRATHIYEKLGLEDIGKLFREII